MNHDIKTNDLYPALHATALNILEAESAILEWKEVIKTTDPDFPAWKEVLDTIRAELTTDDTDTTDDAATTANNIPDGYTVTATTGPLSNTASSPMRTFATSAPMTTSESTDEPATYDPDEYLKREV